jgi:hypothetical protein
MTTDTNRSGTASTKGDRSIVAQVLTIPSDFRRFSVLVIGSRVAASRLVFTHPVEKHHEKNSY